LRFGAIEMRGRPTNPAPFLEWGREEIVLENRATGQRTTRVRRFIQGTWVGKLMLAASATAVIASVFLIPSEGPALLRWVLSRAF
jgi:hypothetical protein